jgi:hypothetical protein
MAAKKDDPTMTSTKSDEGVHRAPAIEDAADSASEKKYADNPDKPGPSSVAQVEVLPEDK